MSDINNRILSEPVPCLEIKKMPNIIISGIYKIENIINHKVYIGQSKNIISRFKRGHLLSNVDKDTILKNAIHKYGYENFTAEVILETYDLDYWEIFFIRIYRSNNRQYGYNMTVGGEGGSTFLGRHHTEETKKLMSLHNGSRGKIYTLEERYAMGNYWRGRHHTEEQKRRMSEACKGINRGPKSEETKRKISKTLMGNIPWNKGIPMTEEQKKKQIEIKHRMYESEKGDVIKQRLREVNTGLYYWNNGEIEIHDKEAPDGFSRGRLGERKYKRKYWYTNGKSDIFVTICPKGFRYGRTFPDMKGERWTNGEINIFAVNCPGENFVKGQFHPKDIKGLLYWNNGEKNVRSKECPGEGFVRGMLRK